MAKINGSDIVTELAQNAGIPKAAAKAYMDTIFELIKTHVENGDTVNVSMFGKFAMKVTAPRKGRDMRTKQIIDIPAKHKLTFEMSRLLQKSYNESSVENIDIDASD